MKKYFFAALLTMGLAAQAHAHLEKGDQILAVQGGVAVPVSQLEITGAYNSRDTFADPGGSIGGQYYYHVLPMLGVGLDVSNSKFNDRTSSSLIENTDSVSGGHSFDVLAVVRGAFIPNGRIHPFVEGGLGVSNTTLKVEATPVSSAVWGDTGTREKRSSIVRNRERPCSSEAARISSSPIIFSWAWTGASWRTSIEPTRLRLRRKAPDSQISKARWPPLTFLPDSV
jgi:opacity protein-like surface antigen